MIKCFVYQIILLYNYIEIIYNSEKIKKEDYFEKGRNFSGVKHVSVDRLWTKLGGT